ncbi:uncharacterized protein [Panulirus ornatus]|uniref:uncharacterized protein n=1 Tax=Panulirus ornatus TaxID=150431 RepID=UPI003A8873B5
MIASGQLPALCSLVLVVALKDVGGIGDRWVGLPEGRVNQVDMILRQVVDQSLAGCHLLLATATEDTQEFSLILRRLAGASQAVTVVEARTMFMESQPTRDHLLRGLWGDTRRPCRALIFNSGSSNVDLAVRFLQASRLWLLPDTPAVIIGSPAVRGTILHHPSLRNTIHVLYLSESQVASPAPFMVRENRSYGT